MTCTAASYFVFIYFFCSFFVVCVRAGVRTSRRDNADRDGMMTIEPRSLTAFIPQKIKFCVWCLQTAQHTALHIMTNKYFIVSFLLGQLFGSVWQFLASLLYYILIFAVCTCTDARFLLYHFPGIVPCDRYTKPILL